MILALTVPFQNIDNNEKLSKRNKPHTPTHTPEIIVHFIFFKVFTATK